MTRLTGVTRSTSNHSNCTSNILAAIVGLNLLELHSPVGSLVTCLLLYFRFFFCLGAIQFIISFRILAMMECGPIQKLKFWCFVSLVSFSQLQTHAVDTAGAFVILCIRLMLSFGGNCSSKNFYN